MSSLLPDDYMASSGYEQPALEHSPESGFDESSAGCYDHVHIQDEWKPISHSDTFSAQSAFEEPSAQQSHMSLIQSAPVYYHPMTSMSLPSTGFSMHAHFQHNNGHAMQMAHHPQWSTGAPMDTSGTMMSQAPMVDSAGHASAMYYPVQMEQVHMEEMYAPRGRARNTSAPPMPVMMGPPQMHWQAAAPMLSASYGDYGHPLSASYSEMPAMGFPMTPERKFSMNRPSSRNRRPAGVPALSFSGLNGSMGAVHSPVSAGNMMTPHSGRSNLSSISDFDSQFSPLSTPRSAGSTPRSATSTPRSGPINEKKRARTGLPHPLERERRVRPKVVAEKGALQCKGVNRKKNTRCRNAALMEFIGPRPLYCAEHITLDPESFYSKCASTFHKVHGDGKGCREVVLKELQFCHKHYNQALDVMLDGREHGFLKARAQLDRITVLQTQLEAEASAAKRIDPDLFQRKHKLIPKFMEMRKLLVKRMQELESTLGHLLPSPIEYTKFEDQPESKDSSSITTSSPSGSSDEASVFEDQPALGMMQVEPQNYPVY
jgi:hypothetical protein